MSKVITAVIDAVIIDAVIGAGDVVFIALIDDYQSWYYC